MGGLVGGVKVVDDAPAPADEAAGTPDDGGDAAAGTPDDGGVDELPAGTTGVDPAVPEVTRPGRVTGKGTAQVEADGHGGGDGAHRDPPGDGADPVQSGVTLEAGASVGPAGRINSPARGLERAAHTSRVRSAPDYEMKGN